MTSKIIRDLPPTENNNRNSEGAFIKLQDGRILFAYSRYGNEGYDDGAAADIYGMISHDDGESFGEPFVMLTHNRYGVENIMSISFARMENGDIGMFFLPKWDTNQCVCYLVRSSDEGKTWSKPVLCSEDRGYFIVNNDRVIRLKSGRLLIPSSLHDNKCKIENGKKVFSQFYPGKLYMFASDDDGITWKTIARDIKIPDSRGCLTGVQEPGILELQDGRIWCYIRTDTGRQYETFSTDEGATWSELLPSYFTSPISPMSTKRLSDGRIIAVWNPVPVYNGRSQHVDGIWTGGRSPLVIALSEDDGETWSKQIPIETDEKSGFCYTAIFETDDKGILLAYCAGGPEDGITLNRLRIRKLYSV